jgi:hypothetical protein
MLVTKDKLSTVRKIALERPAAAGALWQGVPHDAFIDAVKEMLTEYGYKVGAVKAATSPDGTDLAASFLLKDTAVLDLEACVALLTSNNRHGSPRLVFGAADKNGNGYAFAEWGIGKLYRNFSLNVAVGEAVAAAKDAHTAAGRFVARLRKTPMNTEKAAVFLTSMARDTTGSTVYFPWANVGKADVLFNHREDWTAWGVYRAVSEVTTADPAMKQIPRLLLTAERLAEVV